MTACLVISNAYAKEVFTKEDMVGKWLCKSTATMKGVSESWAYSNVIVETFDDGTAKSIAMNEAGFFDHLFAYVYNQSHLEWTLKDDKLYSKLTKIDNHVVYINQQGRVDEQETKTIKEDLIKNSQDNHQYPAILTAKNKDSYVLMSTTPPKEDDMFENYSQISCQRLLSS